MTPPEQTVLREALRTGYALDIAELTVEADGADSGTYAWRATTSDGGRRFVKLRTILRPASILVPPHLRDHGLPEVVAALPTRTGDAWLELDGWTVVVMELVDGATGLRAGLDLAAWHRLGDIAARLHATRLPDALAAVVPVEDFRSGATAFARDLDARIETLDPAALDDHALAVRRRWRAERTAIRQIVDLADELGARIRARIGAPPFVLCHADFHAGNVLVEPGGGLRIVDWDEIVFAPRERDLVFVRGSVVAGRVSDAAADAFEAGYGPALADPELIAFYRVGWAVQDVGSFADEVLFQPDRKPPTRPRSRRLFEGQFDAGGQVEAALALADRAGASRPVAAKDSQHP